jgi:hypothetical protein
MKRFALGVLIAFPWLPAAVLAVRFWPSSLDAPVDEPWPREYIVSCCPARAGQTMLCVDEYSAQEWLVQW